MINGIRNIILPVGKEDDKVMDGVVLWGIKRISGRSGLVDSRRGDLLTREVYKMIETFCLGWG